MIGNIAVVYYLKCIDDVIIEGGGCSLMTFDDKGEQGFSMAEAEHLMKSYFDDPLRRVRWRITDGQTGFSSLEQAVREYGARPPDSPRWTM